MTIGGALFDEVRNRWAAQIGVLRLDALEGYLARLVERRPVSADDLARFDDGPLEENRVAALDQDAQ
ncbi:hypothetical protein [Streptomyces antimycoticus]|uniref:hypothetical protein n=1 Tax=Streptomyces antimycoticus TaxID=68175 RepID=UPI00342F6D06